MVLEYFSLKRGENKSKEDNAIKSPVLSEEDEQFLQRITSEENPPPLPARPVVILDNGNQVEGKDAQVALMDGADKIPLPASPPVESDVGARGAEHGKAESKPADGKKTDGKMRNYLAQILAVTQRGKGKNKSKGDAGETLASAAETFKSGGAPNVNPDGTVNKAEATKEEEDLSKILDQLNLAAVNNRVFSFSKESQELMDKFKLVLKDLINGVPTAYNDLEKLLKHSNEQLESMFNAMPPFLKKLVKSMPAKMSATLGPEFLAAAAEKPGIDAQRLDPGSSKVGDKKKKRSKIPSLERLVSQQGAVVGMLRGIMNFLKLRFPAFMTGTNVLLSLALFLLLFVFWYCHKRGRETRLEKERAAAEASASELEVSETSELEDSIELSPATEFHKDPTSQDKPRATVADLPSVLDLPEPSSVPLPAQSPGAEKELADGDQAKAAA